MDRKDSNMKLSVSSICPQCKGENEVKEPVFGGKFKVAVWCTNCYEIYIVYLTRKEEI